MRSNSRALVLIGVVAIAAVALGIAITAGATPTDTSVDSSDGLSVDVLVEQSSENGATIDEVLREETGETVVILDVEREIDVERHTMTKTGPLQADSESTLGPVVDEVAALEEATVRNQLWLGNLLTVQIDLDTHDIEELAHIDEVTHVAPNVEFSLPDPVTPGGVSDDSIAAANVAGELETADGETVSIDTAAEPTDIDSVDEPGTVTYGLDQLDVPGFEAAFDGERGANATVAIVDTGLSNPEEGHPDLDITKQYLIQDGEVMENETEEGSAHGEHVAGTATGAADPAGDVPRYGVAPEADLINIDVFGASPGASFADIILGLEQSVEDGADVAGFSLGASNTAFRESTFREIYTDVIVDANTAGTAVTVSAGNEGLGPIGGQVSSPATQFDAFTIGASTETGDIASFSSGAVITDRSVLTPAGDEIELPEFFPREYVKPDVAAGGDVVLSAGPLGLEVEDPAAEYSTASGTSMAQPHVAGAVALLQSVTDETLAPKQIETALAETADKPETAPGLATERDIRYGTGIINVTAAALALQDAQSVAGTITDAESGDGIVGATIETEHGGLTTSRTAGTYTSHPSSSPAQLTADAFGYESETITVTDSEDHEFELDPVVTAESFQEQLPFAVAGGDIDPVFDLANVEALTVDLVGASDVDPDELTVTIDDEEFPVGEQFELDESLTADGVSIPVSTTAAVENGSTVALQYTFAGPGDDTVVETGETEILDEIPPAAFEVIDVSAPSTVSTDDQVAIEAEVANVGGQTGSTELLTGIQDDENIIFFPPEESFELAAGETSTLAVDFGTINDINDNVPAIRWGPGDELEAVQQVGENLHPGEEPLPEVEDQLTSPVTVVPDGEPYFLIEELDAPAQVDPGSTIDVTANITNIGQEADSQDIGYQFDDSVVDTEPALTLEPDESATVQFTDIELPEEENIYEHGVATENSTEFAEIIVGDPEPPEFELSNFQQPDKLGMDEPIIGEVTVTNIGGATGDVELLYGTDIDEEFVFRETGIGSYELDPGESTTVEENLLTFEDINEILDLDYGPGDEVLTGFQLGHNVNPDEPPEPELVDERAANISIGVDIDVTGDGNPATDTTGDGLLNDLDGDGEFDVFDVQALFNNLNDDAVTENVDLFDFNDDGDISVFDVQALFEELTNP